MSSKANKIKKSVLGGKLKFPVEMYNTTVGSIVICCLMFTKKEVNYKEIRALWKKFKAQVEKGEEPFDMQKESFVDDVLKYFGLHRPVYFLLLWCRVRTTYCLHHTTRSTKWCCR